MSSRPKEEEVKIPEFIFDNKTNKKYQRGSFLGKVMLLFSRWPLRTRWIRVCNNRVQFNVSRLEHISYNKAHQ